MSRLFELIKEDFGIQGNGRWLRGITHDSIVYDSQRDRFFWNSRGISGNVKDYLIKVRGISPAQITESLLAAPTLGGAPVVSTNTVVYDKLVDAFHVNLLNGDKTYFTNRGITLETMRRFLLGKYGAFYTIPFFEDGRLKQIQLRRDSPKLIKNYYKGVGPVIFNSDILKITDRVYITEGVIGCILLAQEGLPAVSMNIGASGFQPEWASKFRQKEIFILFDNDQAGINGAARIARILGEYRCKIHLWDEDAPGYAVDDYLLDGHSVEELLCQVEEKSKYVFQIPNVKLPKIAY